MPVIDFLQCNVLDVLPDWIEEVQLIVRNHEQASNIFAIYVDGSVTAKDDSIKGFLFMYDGYRVVRPGTTIMPDIIRKRNPNNPNQLTFSAAINLIGLPTAVTIEILARKADSVAQLVAKIKVVRRSLPTSYRPKYRLIPMQTQGRSGSTWLMRLLSLHPDILIDPRHPYEFKGAQYYINMLRALTQPSIHPNTATTSVIYRPEDHSFPPNPYYCISSEQRWAIQPLGKMFPPELANLIIRCIDQLYSMLDAELCASPKGQRKAVIFDRILRANLFNKRRLIIEKQVTFPDLVNELYSHRKQIFLFRDPRDVICSIHSFFEKTGVSITGKTVTFSDLAFPKMIMEGFQLLWQRYIRQKDSAHRINYEHLIVNTEDELMALLRYLEVNSTSRVARKMIEKGSKRDQSSETHQTSSSPESSTQRWKTDLPESLQLFCSDLAGEELSAAGYD